MKRCTGCLQVLELERFALKCRSCGIRQSRCRSCTSLQAQAYYRLNPSRYKARAAAGKPSTMVATRIALREYLLAHGCAD